MADDMMILLWVGGMETSLFPPHYKARRYHDRHALAAPLLRAAAYSSHLFVFKQYFTKRLPARACTMMCRAAQQIALL
jgi:hypothetical protein